SAKRSSLDVPPMRQSLETQSRTTSLTIRVAPARSAERWLISPLPLCARSSSAAFTRKQQRAPTQPGLLLVVRCERLLAADRAPAPRGKQKRGWLVGGASHGRVSSRCC